MAADPAIVVAVFDDVGQHLYLPFGGGGGGGGGDDVEVVDHNR